MARPARLTRRFPAQMSEDGYRRLKALSDEAGLSEGEMLSFVFENLSSIINGDNFSHRLRLYKSKREVPET